MTTPEAHPLHWPTGWPRSTARSRARFGQKNEVSYGSRFGQVTVFAALRRLEDELLRLGVKIDGYLVSSNIITRRDGLPRSAQREPDDPGVAVYFKLKGKDKVLACDRWDRVADNIVAIAKHIDAIRGMERWGVGTVEQAFAGYEALPPPVQRHWREVFGVPKDADVGAADIEARYRAMARECHPDRGGSHERMVELNAARQAALDDIGGK